MRAPTHLIAIGYRLLRNNDTQHMPQVLSFEGRQVSTQEGETVLDALTRAGLDPAFSCKSGSCHTCMLQAESGDIPERAQRALSTHLQRLRYFLPCRCTAQTDMRLRRPHPNDLVTACQLCEASVPADDGRITLIFEPTRTIKYRTGQQLRIVNERGDEEPTLTITSDPQRDMLMIAVLDAGAAKKLPTELQGQCGDAAFGFAFDVRGPFDDVTPEELPYPPSEPALWSELGGDRFVRTALEAFYDRVYADDLLAPFFIKVTKQRAIDKQFSFMKQCVTGDNLYMGDRPRNAHHWMIITHELFDHRQQLMRETLQAHGLSDSLITRWQALEEYFRPDMVKSAALPRYLGNIAISHSGFSEEVLGEGSLCDHCQGEVNAGETVLLHHHLGTISCMRCAEGVVSVE